MFQPYTIEHLQLRDLPHVAPSDDKRYFVLWHNQYPFGHLWYEPPFEPEAFRDAIFEAVSPALTYYLGGMPPRELNLREELFNGVAVCEQLDKALQSPSVEEPSRPTITIVICTRNRPHALRQCVEQLYRSKDLDFELLVVDNASDTDETRDVVAGFNGARYVREDRPGLDIARNTGVQHASHEIIAYTDDDVVVDLEWVTRIKEGFRNPLTMALTGLTIPLTLETEAQCVFEREWGFNKGYLPKTFDYSYVRRCLDSREAIPAWDVGAGANMAFRRAVFKVVGGFDERLDVGASGCSGDSEMWHRIMSEGWNCVYIPEMVVYHQHRKTMPQLRRQIYYYMKGHVSALFVQYQKYKQEGDIRRVRRTLPWWYMQRLKACVKARSAKRTRLLTTEISGCIAGWWYYRQHASAFAHPSLSKPRESLTPKKPDASTQVAVIITCYNYGHYLPQAIDSIRNQTHPNYQIIVVDDGSDDNTAAVCAAYQEVTYVRTDRVGVSMARNTGVLLTQSDYVLFLDADDWLYPNALELQLYYFGNYPDIAFVAGGFTCVDAAGEVLAVQPKLSQHRDEFYTHLLTGNFIGMQSNTMYRRDLFFDFYFDSSFNGCEDYDLNLRISRHYPAFSYTERIAVYRKHLQSVSQNVDGLAKQVFNVMEKQRPLLRTSAEREAFEAGISNWRAYFGELMD